MSQLENALLFGTFEEARLAILGGDDISQYELQQLAVKAGLGEEMAHLVVTAVMVATKKRVFAEVKKQTDNLLYWVERV